MFDERCKGLLYLGLRTRCSSSWRTGKLKSVRSQSFVHDGGKVALGECRESFAGEKWWAVAGFRVKEGVCEEGGNAV